MELGTALALVAFVDQCTRYGEKLVQKCRAYKNAENETRQLLTIIEHNWMKTGAQLKFLKTIAASLDESYLAMQSRVLSELEGKLKKATLTMKQLSAGQEWIDNHDEKAISARLRSLQNMTSTKKSLYALKKKSLETIIEDLEKWQTRFDPSWMLLILMENPSINVELVKESKKAQSDQSSFIMTTKEMRDIAKLNIMETTSGQQAVWLDTEILDSPDTFATRTNPTLVSIATLKDTKQEVILDTMHCNPAADILRTTKEVCNLARVLGKVDPIIFGLLKCRGIIRDSEVVKDKLGTSKRLPMFTFVFDISPNLSSPRNLRSILREAKPYSLNERLELAKKLTHSVLYVHTARFVHKNIRPETIVVFEDNKSEIGAPFLLGFEKIRHEDGQTYNAGDVFWEKNLYRHPSRQGTLPEETYRMQHDIYSLGVILLEIGLWTSFVNYESYSDEDEPTAAVPSKMIAHMSLGDEKDRHKVAFGNKDILETLAGQELPVRMGQRYTDAVLSCLQCLDGGDKGGSNSEFVDEDGLIIGVRFVESILGKVHEILF